jgi:hypothetical protein
MKRRMLTIVTAAALALLIHGGFAPRLLAQPSPPAPADNPPPPPGPGMMGRPGMGGPGTMGGPTRPNFPDLMANRIRHMQGLEQQGCGGMGPEMGMGPGMGMGMGMMPSDKKSQAQIMQLHGKTMQMWGEWMEKRGKELEQQAK